MHSFVTSNNGISIQGIYVINQQEIALPFKRLQEISVRLNYHDHMQKQVSKQTNKQDKQPHLYINY